MSIAETERFAADLKSNEGLRAEVANVQANTSLDRMVAFAASKGYAFTADEAKEHLKARAAATSKVLTDAELDGAAGGGTAADFFGKMDAGYEGAINNSF